MSFKSYADRQRQIREIQRAKEEAYEALRLVAEQTFCDFRDAFKAEISKFLKALGYYKCDEDENPFSLHFTGDKLADVFVTYEMDPELSMFFEIGEQRLGRIFAFPVEDSKPPIFFSSRENEPLSACGPITFEQALEEVFLRA